MRKRYSLHWNQDDYDVYDSYTKKYIKYGLTRDEGRKFIRRIVRNKERRKDFYDESSQKNTNIISRIIKKIFPPPTREELKGRRIKAKRQWIEEKNRRKRQDMIRCSKWELDGIMDRHSDHFH